VLHDLVSAKVIATIVGWLIMDSMKLTLLNVLWSTRVLVRKKETDVGIKVSEWVAEPANGSNNGLVSLCFMLYLGALFSTAAYALHVRQVHHLHGTLVGSALTMIPAWAWKDFVNRFILLSTRADRTGLGSVLHAVFLACITVMLSAGLQLFADKYLDRTTRRPTLIRVSMYLLAGSLGLGCGYAVNYIFKSSFEGIWGDVSFQLVYTSVLTFVLPRVQQVVRERTSGINCQFSRRFCDFMVLSGNFLLSWAWKGLVDAAFVELAGQPVGGLAEPLTVTVVGPVAVFAAARSPRQRLREGVALVVGMNIGWAWLDWCNVGFLSSEIMTRRRLEGLWTGTLALLLPLLAIQMILWHPKLAPTCCLPRHRRDGAEEDEGEADMEVVDAGPGCEGS
jgi:hypothetical protein